MDNVPVVIKFKVEIITYWLIKSPLSCNVNLKYFTTDNKFKVLTWLVSTLLVFADIIVEKGCCI